MNSPSKKDLFGSARLDEITEPLRSSKPDTLVPYSTRIKRSTYLHLKQAKYYVAGFVEQDFVDAAIRAALEKLPEAAQPLPPGHLAALEKQNKKLKP